MALRDLSNNTMITITAAWLDSARERPLFEASPILAPCLDGISAAHDGLARFQRRDATNAALAAELAARSAKRDLEHDRLVRGLYNTMTGMADLLGEGEDASALVVARDELLPDGIATVNLAYSDEVGNALIAGERLSPRSRAVLKAYGVLGKKLSTWMGAWRDAATKLGEAETDRAERLGGGEVATRADALRAHNEWVRVVSFVVTALGFDKSLDAAAQRRILLHLEAADAKAARSRDRKAGGDASAEDGTVPGDEPVTPPAPPVVATPAAPAPKPAPADHVSPASPAPAPPPA